MDDFKESLNTLIRGKITIRHFKRNYLITILNKGYKHTIMLYDDGSIENRPYTMALKVAYRYCDLIMDDFFKKTLDNV